MSNKQIYRQCSLELPLENGGKLIDTAWIPAKLAKIGKRLVIDTKAEGYRDGWVVKSVGGSREESEVKNQTEAQRAFEKKLDKKNRRDKE
jgi:hypothetical protein